MIALPASVAYTHVFKAYLSSDHLTAATGKTIAITISKNGGAFGNPSAGATNATEISIGWYSVALSTTDMNTVGVLAISGTAALVDTVDDRVYVANANTGGWAALPNTACTTNASLLTSGTGTAQISNSSGLVALQAAQKVDVDTIKTNPVVNAGTITFPTGATLASTTNITSATGITASTVSDKTGYALTAGEHALLAADILDSAAGIETGKTVRQGLKLILSVCAGKASGLDLGAPVYRDTNDTVNRVTATTDTYGNRTAVTYNVT